MKKRFSVLGLAAAILAPAVAGAVASDPVRVVVVPDYREEAPIVRQDYEASNYRRMMRFIEQQPVSGTVMPINPFSEYAADRQYAALLDRARIAAPSAMQEVTHRLSADAAYVVRLTTTREQGGDGLCRVHADMEGEAYGNAGEDLGLGMSKRFTVTRRYCEDAVADAEQEVGLEVRRALARFRDDEARHAPAQVRNSDTHRPVRNAGLLQRQLDALSDTVTVRLEGVIDQETLDLFGDLINGMPGVVEANNVRIRMPRGRPEGGVAVWRVQLEGMDPFELQIALLREIEQLRWTGGIARFSDDIDEYSRADLRGLKSIRVADATAQGLVFVLGKTDSWRHQAANHRGTGFGNRYDAGFE